MFRKKSVVNSRIQTFLKVLHQKRNSTRNLYWQMVGHTSGQHHLYDRKWLCALLLKWDNRLAMGCMHFPPSSKLYNVPGKIDTSFSTAALVRSKSV